MAVILNQLAIKLNKNFDIVNKTNFSESKSYYVTKGLHSCQFTVKFPLILCCYISTNTVYNNVFHVIFLTEYPTFMPIVYPYFMSPNKANCRKVGLFSAAIDID